MTTVTINTEFTIEAPDTGTRLDHFLVAQYPEHSRSKIQKWIAGALVKVNKKKVAKHHFLSVGDVISINVLEEEKVITEEHKQDIPVLFEDDYILVLNKPTGVLVHPTEQSAEWTLAQFLVERFPAVATVGEDPQRPGIVHRLDRPASGVIVTAKTQEAFDSLKAQFADRTVDKEYRAIVHGVPVKEHDVLKFKIARSKTKSGKMAARPEHEEGRDAWTEYDILRTKNDRYAELAVRIKTGRSHQIRAHLAAINNPIVVDPLYATQQSQLKKEYPRLFLHAARIEITHPVTGERMSWEAEIPANFSEFMAQ